MARKYVNPNRAAAREDGRLRAPARAIEDRRAAEPVAARLDGHEWAKSFRSFLRAIGDEHDAAGARTAIRNATMGERVGSEGGYLVPWNLQEQVLALMTDAIVRPRATYAKALGLRESFPVLENYDQSTPGQALGGLEFSFVEEGEAYPETAPEFGVTTLDISKAGAYISGVPNELLSDAVSFTEVFLPQTVARGLSYFEDELFIASGSGVGQPQALVNAPGALAVTRQTSGAVVLEDLAAMWAGLLPESRKNAVWLVSHSADTQLLNLYVTAAGQVWNGTELVTAQMPTAPPDWYRPGAADGNPEILGVPAAVNDHNAPLGSHGDVILVDLSRFVVADRGEMLMEVSSKGSGFPDDASSIRITHRVDGRFWPQSTYASKAGTELSPLVVLH